MNYWMLYWLNLHWLAFNYPVNPKNKEKKQILLLIEKMQNDGIQCIYCRNHFKNFLLTKDLNKIIENRDSLFSFFWECHNDVNKRNNKKVLLLDDAYLIYNKISWSDLLKDYEDPNLHEKKLPSLDIDILKLFKSKKLNEFPSLLFSTWFNKDLQQEKQVKKSIFKKLKIFLNKIKKKILK